MPQPNTDKSPETQTKLTEPKAAEIHAHQPLHTSARRTARRARIVRPGNLGGRYVGASHQNGNAKAKTTYIDYDMALKNGYLHPYKSTDKDARDRFRSLTAQGPESSSAQGYNASGTDRCPNGNIYKGNYNPIGSKRKAAAEATPARRRRAKDNRADAYLIAPLYTDSQILANILAHYDLDAAEYKTERDGLDYVRSSAAFTFKVMRCDKSKLSGKDGPFSVSAKTSATPARAPGEGRAAAGGGQPTTPHTPANPDSPVSAFMQAVGGVIRDADYTLIS